LLRRSGPLMEPRPATWTHRYEFRNGLLAEFLPVTDEATALAVAYRLCDHSTLQVRMGKELGGTSLVTSGSALHVSERVMEIMAPAESAMKAAVERGGDWRSKRVAVVDKGHARVRKIACVVAADLAGTPLLVSAFFRHRSGTLRRARAAPLLALKMIRNILPTVGQQPRSNPC